MIFLPKVLCNEWCSKVIIYTTNSFKRVLRIFKEHWDAKTCSRHVSSMKGTIQGCYSATHQPWWRWHFSCLAFFNLQSLSHLVLFTVRMSNLLHCPLSLSGFGIHDLLSWRFCTSLPLLFWPSSSTCSPWYKSASLHIQVLLVFTTHQMSQRPEEQMCYWQDVQGLPEIIPCQFFQHLHL